MAEIYAGSIVTIVRGPYQGDAGTVTRLHTLGWEGFVFVEFPDGGNGFYLPEDVDVHHVRAHFAFGEEVYIPSEMEFGLVRDWYRTPAGNLRYEVVFADDCYLDNLREIDLESSEDIPLPVGV